MLKYLIALLGKRHSRSVAPEASLDPAAARESTAAEWIDDHGISRSVTDVFISYARSDLPRVRVIAEKLKDAGLSVFWDRMIPAGVDYQHFLGEALDHSRLVLVVWSREAISSDWVRAEAEYARVRKRLISCRIEECSLGPPFNTFHTADLREPVFDLNWPDVLDLISHRVRSGNANGPLGDVVL